MATDDRAEAPRTAAELIDRVQIDWAALEYVVAALSEEQLSAPGPDGRWAVKDHLAHIAEWERATAAVLARRPQWVGFGLDAETYGLVSRDIDRLNDMLYQRSRALSIVDIQANARAAHAEVLAALGKLSDADVQATIAAYGADPADHRPLLNKIASDTYAHYAEHTGWITEQLNQ